jgi:hypothetical protein
MYIFLFQVVSSLYLLQLVWCRHFPSLPCTYFFVIVSTRGCHIYMYVCTCIYVYPPTRTYVHTHTTYLILFESIRLLPFGTTSLTVWLYDSWRWDNYIVLNFWALITQWHSTTFHKNGGPRSIQSTYILCPEYPFVKDPKSYFGNTYYNMIQKTYWMPIFESTITDCRCH